MFKPQVALPVLRRDPRKKSEPVFIDTLANKDFSIPVPFRAIRGGIIVKCDNYYALGVDQKSEDITDFGGGISKRDANLLEGCMREFNEETFSVFGTFTFSGKETVVYDSNKFLVIADLALDRELISNKFQQRLLTSTDTSEITDILWFTGQELKELLSETDTPLYLPTRYLLQHIEDRL